MKKPSFDAVLECIHRRVENAPDRHKCIYKEAFELEREEEAAREWWDHTVPSAFPNRHIVGLRSYFGDMDNEGLDIDPTEWEDACDYWYDSFQSLEEFFGVCSSVSCYNKPRPLP